MAGKEGESGAGAKDDVFGVPRDEAGRIVPPEAPKAAEPKFVEVDGKKFVDDGTGKPKLDDKNEPVLFVEKKDDKGIDIENHPAIAQLKTELKTALEKAGKADQMGENLAAQREIMDALKDRIKLLEKGNGGGKEPVFKDIKRVKDLPKEEQEAMTDAEKRLHDQNADLMEKINGIVSDSDKKDAATQTEKEKADEKAKADKKAADDLAAFNTKAQGVALKVAGNDQKMANAIIAEFNNFAGNEKLDDAGLLERMNKAAKLVPDYKPQKEQKSPTGGAVKEGNENADDPFGNQNIVDTVQKGKRGGYQL
jgi:hypothetical protein